MAKRKKQTTKTFHNTRRRAPKVKFKKDGGVDYIECPFCHDAHPIIVGSPAHCGTHLELVAVQPTTSQTGGITCSRCGEMGGTMVKAGEKAYIHSYQCSPKNIYMTPPKKSFFARLAWILMSDKVMVKFAGRFKRYPEQLLEIGEDGLPTEKVVGYCWRKL